MKKELLEKLNKQILACQKCDLRRGCTQVVPGEGSSEAEIMFIGEGPGQKEDESGVPFVGAAGKFLDEMLGVISLKRDEVYIANVVKCRPPANRDPLPEEAESCWPWLEKQIGKDSITIAVKFKTRFHKTDKETIALWEKWGFSW